MKTIDDLFARLRVVQNDFRAERDYDARTVFLLEQDGTMNVFLPDVGQAISESFKAGELDAPESAAFKAQVESAIVASRSGRSGVDEAKSILKYLDVRGYNVMGPDPDKEPVERLIDALSAVALGGDKTTKTVKLSALEKRTPQLDRGDGKWVKNTLAAGLEGVDTATLKTYRYNGKANQDDTFGRDPNGRIWRREGTPKSHPWYLKSSLIREQQKP